MITETMDLSPDVFHEGTGWEIKPEGACKGEVCVPLPHGFSATDAASRLGMAVAHDEGSGLWALGPESLNGRALVTATAPDVTLSDIDGNTFHLIFFARQEGGRGGLGAVLRLPLRPARVAGALRRTGARGRRNSHRLTRAQRP